MLNLFVGSDSLWGTCDIFCERVVLLLSLPFASLLFLFLIALLGLPVRDRTCASWPWSSRRKSFQSFAPGVACAVGWPRATSVTPRRFPLIVRLLNSVFIKKTCSMLSHVLSVAAEMIMWVFPLRCANMARSTAFRSQPVPASKD